MFAIVPADPSLADELSRLVFTAKAHWGYPPDWMEQWRSMLTVSADFLRAQDAFVARCGKDNLGFVALLPEGGRIWLEHLWITPSAQRQGLGQALFRHALARAADRGYAWLEIESDPHALGFYERQGAVRTGTRHSSVLGVARELPLLRCPTQPEQTPTDPPAG